MQRHQPTTQTTTQPHTHSHFSFTYAQVTAVVTQPGRPKGRGNRKVATASPVEEAARAGGVEEQRVLCPVKANEVCVYKEQCVCE